MDRNDAVDRYIDLAKCNFETLKKRLPWNVGAVLTQDHVPTPENPSYPEPIDTGEYTVFHDVTCYLVRKSFRQRPVSNYIFFEREFQRDVFCAEASRRLISSDYIYRYQAHVYKINVCKLYIRESLTEEPMKVKATVRVGEKFICITNVRFKEEESGMKTLTIHNVEATLYFCPGCKLVYIDNAEYERRIKERCEYFGYDKKPFDDYSNQFGDGVRFIVNDYTGPFIPDKTYVKMDCDVIIKDSDDFNVVNIKCNRIIPHVYCEYKEEETDMLKKETNKESYARVAAAARRYTEYRQYRDQMRAPVPPAITDIKFNGPATIIFWRDGTKTVVKQQDGEATYDKEKAIAMALLKKSYPGFAYHKLFNLDEYFGKQLRAAEKKRYNILSQIKNARKPKVLARLEQELYKIDDEIARLKKEVEKFE